MHMIDLIHELSAIITKQGHAINALQQQVELLMAHKPSKPVLRFEAMFPDPDTIIKLQAQLWVNKPKQGVTSHNLKVYVWTNDPKRNPDHWPDGYWIGWNFPLRLPTCWNDTGTLLPIDQWARNITDADGCRIGCVEHKGKTRGKKISGTKCIPCHSAMFAEETMELELNIQGCEFDFGRGEPAKKTGDNAPVHIWYWQPKR